MIETVLGLNVFGFLLVFSRLGSAVMLMPGFGETQVSPRIRLATALWITLVVMPVVARTLPGVPQSPGELMLVLSGELFVGLFLGGLVRVLMAAIQVAGAVVAAESGLMNALVPEMASQQQVPVATNMLVVLALVLIFAADLHHAMIRGVVDSYEVFPPGNLPPVGDFADAFSRVVQKTFSIGLQMAAPLVLVGLLVSLGMGVMARVMPQIQIFFVAAPLQMVLGLVVFAATLAMMMGWFLQALAELLDTFVPAG